MFENNSSTKQVLRIISIVSGVCYVSLFVVMSLDLALSLATQKVSQNFGIEFSLFVFFLSSSLFSALLLTLMSRNKPSVHHARKFLGKHVAHLNNEELHEHIKHH